MTAGTPQTPERAPGMSDALRATVGVACAYGAALLLAGLVAIISGASNEGVRSAGDTRAQLAVQAVIFAGAALLLVEGLRLAHRPRERNPLAALARESVALPAAATVIVVGLAAAVGAQLIGPLVGALLPNLQDGAVPVDELGLGTGIGADLGTVVVVAGLVPFGEELLFRGVLVGAWARAGRPGVAVLSSAGAVRARACHRRAPSDGDHRTPRRAPRGGHAALSRSLGSAVLAHALRRSPLVNAGLTDLVPILVLVVTVIVTTAAAIRISRSVSCCRRPQVP